MTAEIICVGTEMLLGDILNSNAQYLAQQLAQLGIPHYYQTVVGDNPERLKEVIEIAASRVQILIFTGGLGPTPDDLTCETIADFFGVPLKERADIIEDIAEKFAQRGRVMSANNRKQALIPQGAEILPNPTGTAPGIIWQPRPGLTIFTFPGVPSEMYQMWTQTAVPFLKSQGWGKEIIYSRSLRFWGIGESALAEKVAPYFNLTNPTVAPYAGKGEVRLRISAKATDSTTAEALITPIEKQLIEIAGLDYYGANDDTLASVVGNLLRSSGETLSIAESCTGGGLGQMLTEIPGSSDYFWGGVIAYDNSVKIGLLGVNPEDLEKFGAVSATVAEQMAAGVKNRLSTTWGLSITGIAGPTGGTETKPVGLVYIGLAGPGDEVTSFEHHLGTIRGRSLIRYVGGNSALDNLRRRLLSTIFKKLNPGFL
ncbi:competence/damage-inducible protein A [Aphanizomenon flos-aquae NRERC-008]|jgi:nicotinamide-nucleotide amidase|uniref:CinA-like protein n=2 Tax=Aphanizomenon flos-aquae TaxID=1176 RepID=A0ABR8IV42_APHFL|nr:MULTISPECIES: competence/damage-inducible protein A [Aphanizomenon]OBQ19578.1 MAG: damage-inducible protein CinA [Anabaena sp. WA113]MBD2391556.1 competence/damage-inducible protein A [Aphanizomenon flos-aquae FACHB-1171]MBD2556063.1 competence/damage-inducible protein A [Aphanizomenon flos-aquae FACHB-1290]MBD2633391.1 competence/damage-inducible protein A [Aphanizomenon sp. FACHB-1399]MBD2644391.1 competence/damage-inducible protein A [Aphanizomenon sp. FACHB-1401]